MQQKMMEKKNASGANEEKDCVKAQNCEKDEKKIYKYEVIMEVRLQKAPEKGGRKIGSRSHQMHIYGKNRTESHEESFIYKYKRYEKNKRSKLIG